MASAATLLGYYEKQQQEEAEADFLVNELLYFQDSSSSDSNSNITNVQPPPPSNSHFDLEDFFDIDNFMVEEDILYLLNTFGSSPPIPSSPLHLQKCIPDTATGAATDHMINPTAIAPPPLPPPQINYSDYLIFPEPEPLPYTPPENSDTDLFTPSSIDNHLTIPPFYPDITTSNKRLKLSPYQVREYDHVLPPTTNCSFDRIVPSFINTSSYTTNPQLFNNYTMTTPGPVLEQIPVYPNYTTNYLPTIRLPHDQQFTEPVPLPPPPPPPPPPPQKEETNATVSVQSIAARERRRKITEKTQEIAKLVPGGTKMNTAEMLQSAAKYVKFLQAQVGLLQLMKSPQYSQSQEAGVGNKVERKGLESNLLHSLLMSQSVQEKIYMTEYCLIPADFVQLLTADDNGIAHCDSSSISDQLKELLSRHS